jgi:hypothetical protein
VVRPFERRKGAFASLVSKDQAANSLRAWQEKRTMREAGLNLENPGWNMRGFAIAVLKRLLVSIAILAFIVAFGSVYGHFVGPSKIAYSCTIVLIAWPWALPQVFIVVSIIGFFTQRIRYARRHGSHPTG